MCVARLRPSIQDIECSLSLCTLIRQHHILRHQRHALHCIRSPHIHFYSTRSLGRPLPLIRPREVAKQYNRPLSTLKEHESAVERTSVGYQGSNNVSPREMEGAPDSYGGFGGTSISQGRESSKFKPSAEAAIQLELWRLELEAKYSSETLSEPLENYGLGTASIALFQKYEKQRKGRFKSRLGQEAKPILEMIHLEKQEAKLTRELSIVPQDLNHGYDVAAMTAELNRIKAVYYVVRKQVEEKAAERRLKKRMRGKPTHGNEMVDKRMKAGEWLAKDVEKVTKSKEKERIIQILKIEAKMEEIKDKEREALEKGEVLDVEELTDTAGMDKVGLDKAVTNIATKLSPRTYGPKVVIKNGVLGGKSEKSILRKAKRSKKRQDTKLRRAARMEKHKGEVEAMIKENPELKPLEALTAIYWKNLEKKLVNRVKRDRRDAKNELVGSEVEEEKLNSSDLVSAQPRLEEPVGTSFEEFAARQENWKENPEVQEFAEIWEDRDRESGLREPEDKLDVPIERFIQQPIPPLPMYTTPLARRAYEELSRDPLIEEPLSPKHVPGEKNSEKAAPKGVQHAPSSHAAVSAFFRREKEKSLAKMAMAERTEEPVDNMDSGAEGRELELGWPERSPLASTGMGTGKGKSKKPEPKWGLNNPAYDAPRPTFKRPEGYNRK